MATKTETSQPASENGVRTETVRTYFITNDEALRVIAGPEEFSLQCGESSKHYISLETARSLADALVKAAEFSESVNSPEQDAAISA